MPISAYDENEVSRANEVLDFFQQSKQDKASSSQLLLANKNNTTFNKKNFNINNNKKNFGIKFKSVYEQLDDRAKYLEKRHHVMTDLFKRNEELYGTRHYDPVKFWKQQCYNTSRFNQNMLINTIWLQALANRAR